MRLIVNSNNCFLKELPQLPGVYKFYNQTQNLLYIGKALNLSNRVKSYFINTNSLEPRIQLFVAQISYIDLITTESEQLALVLEKKLIFKLQPKYNILLKHDNTSVGILLSNHLLPRLSYYRTDQDQTINNDNYFPLINSKTALNLIEIIQKLYQLRTCSDYQFQQKKACILHQIKRCSAPCISNISNKQYQQQVKEVKQILSGQKHDTIKKISKQIKTASKELNFEKATIYRELLKILNISLVNNYH